MYADVAASAQRRYRPVSEFASRLRGSAHHRDRHARGACAARRAACAGGERRGARCACTRACSACSSLDFTLQDRPANSGRRHAHRVVALAHVPGPAPRRAAQPRTPRCRARATLLARDGSVLAESAAHRSAEPADAREATRNSPLGDVADAVARHASGLFRRHAARRSKNRASSAQAIVGLSGLELALDERLRGTPGGELLAGSASARLRGAARGARRSARRSPQRCSARPSPRSAASSAGSSRCSPPPARSSPSPASASTACSRPARRSR